MVIWLKMATMHLLLWSVVHGGPLIMSISHCLPVHDNNWALSVCQSVSVSLLFPVCGGWVTAPFLSRKLHSWVGWYFDVRPCHSIRNVEISATAGLPSISKTSGRRNSLFSHVARLADDVPSHKALSSQINISLGQPANNQWSRYPSRPRNRWVDQIRRDNNLHLPTSGGVLSIVVTTVWRCGPCRLCINNNNNLSPTAPGHQLASGHWKTS